MIRVREVSQSGAQHQHLGNDLEIRSSSRHRVHPVRCHTLEVIGVSLWRWSASVCCLQWLVHYASIFIYCLNCIPLLFIFGVSRARSTSCLLAGRQLKTKSDIDLSLYYYHHLRDVLRWGSLQSRFISLSSRPIPLQGALALPPAIAQHPRAELAVHD
jgi:hypothetical protein